MLNIEISFQDSWTNQFLDEHRNPLFTSMSGFNAKQRKLSNVVFNSNTAPQQTLVEHVRQQNRDNPGMALRVPATYDNTVRGVVARLLGEVRRLSNLDAEHPLHSVSFKPHVCGEDENLGRYIRLDTFKPHVCGEAPEQAWIGRNQTFKPHVCGEVELNFLPPIGNISFLPNF